MKLPACRGLSYVTPQDLPGYKVFFWVTVGTLTEIFELNGIFSYNSFFFFLLKFEHVLVNECIV